MQLLKNTIWNLTGFVIPSLVAIPAMGFLARTLGVERIGLFTIAYAIIGYASIFDAGLSRAVIRFISINRDDDIKVQKIIGTSTYIVGALSIVASIVIFSCSKTIAELLHVSPNIVTDTVFSLKLLSLSLTPFLLSQVWIAYLEGIERFDKVNKQKIVTNTIMAFMPIVTVSINNNLSSAILGLVFGRWITAIISVIVLNESLRGRNGREHRFLFDINIARNLFGFGGWITVSNIISPLMVYFDRFIISNINGAASVAFYTAPSEAIARMLIIPGAASRAIFPFLSSGRKENELSVVTIKAMILLGIGALIITTPVFIFSQEILLIWMGSAFVGSSSDVLRILLVGFVFTAVAQIPFARIQALGKSKVTAAIHLAELVPYFLILVFMANKYGVVGVAISWSLRVIVDSIILTISMLCLTRKNN